MTPVEEALAQEVEQLGGMVRDLLDAVAAHETLLEDVLAMVAETDSGKVGEMRDAAAAELQRHIDKTTLPGAVGWEGFWRKRFDTLNAVMNRVGKPYQAAEVTDLAQFRALGRASDRGMKDAT